MKDKCEAREKEAELIQAQDFRGGDMYLCESCYNEAQQRADYEQERYKEKRRKDGFSNRP